MDITKANWKNQLAKINIVLGWIYPKIVLYYIQERWGDIMQVNINNIVSISEANQNFSKVARLVDEHGTAVILKNNIPRYVLLDFSQFQKNAESDDDHIEQIADKFMKKHLKAFEELSKWLW